MTDPILEVLARRLRELRYGRRITRDQIQASTGLVSGTVKKWERGDLGAKGPTVLDLVTLARFYRVSLDWLLGLAEDAHVLPPGHIMVDMVTVERIREATSETDIKGVRAYAIKIPRLRAVYPPHSQEWLDLKSELEKKLTQLKTSEG